MVKTSLNQITRLTIALLFVGIGLIPPSQARLRMIPLTDKELAARGAAIYGLLLNQARQEDDVPAVAFTRLACRTWAFQSLKKLMEGAEVKELSPPPNAEGWRDLSLLLFQSRRYEDGLKVLERTRPILDESDRLFLEIAFRICLDLGIDRPAARLLELVQNPIIAKRLVQRWWMASQPPFREDEYEIPLDASDAVSAEIVAKLKPWIIENQKRAEEKFDTWTLRTPEAAPGQEILIVGQGPAEPAWRAAVFSQNRKSFPAEIHRSSGHRSSRNRVYQGQAVLSLPKELSPGSSARIAIPKIGEFEIKVVSRPVPAQIRSIFPARTLPGGWMRIECVGLLTSRRNQPVHVSEKDKSQKEEWPITALFSQGGQEWKVERNVQMWRGWIQDNLVFRLPWGLTLGEAQIRVNLADAVSVPYEFNVGEWPDLSNFQRSYSNKELVAMPGSTLTLMFHHPADDFAGLVESPSGRIKIWKPEHPAAPGQMNSESKWRIPKEWEIGIHDVVWAVREGGLWTVPSLQGETLIVSPFAAAPENLHATFIRSAQQGTVTTLGNNGYESIPYRQGDIMINGDGIEKGETYDITVRFALGNVYSIRQVSSHDYILMVNVSSTGPTPESLEIQRVIADIAGMPARIPIREHGGVMGDLFTAQTSEGKVAVDWLTDVRSKLRAAQFQDQPPIDKLLWTLRIDTFPISPWGGQWTYVRTPGHPSLTFLAHDWRGNLRAQFYSGGIGAGLVEYDLLTRDENMETFGISADNFYWTYPWSSNGLGNLIADAVRSAARADIGIHNTLGLRGNIPAGPLTKDLIKHVLPFDNDLIVLHLKGSDFLDLYKEAYASGKFLYVSGLSAEVDSGPGRFDVQFKMALGKIFTPEMTYRVAMPSYLAEKRAGYPKTEKSTERESNGKTVREALIDHIQSRRAALTADRSSRIVERIYR